jgi:NAD(P)-dependent dehydrogenase (short-subunit alcohol dehydrogenase family)
MTNTTQQSRQLALVTGASRGLGRALAHGLADSGWHLILDARTPPDLASAAADIGEAVVAAIPGDVADPAHRADLNKTVAEQEGLDLLVANASTLGPSPQPGLADYPLDELRRVYEVNVLAPLALAQLLIPALAARNGTILNITSDASVEPYEGWGGYGSSKAALDQLTAILGAEQPGLRVYAVDPGDMRTQMHQDAFPGEDISDRPEPETVVPALLELLRTRPKSGRLRASDFRTQARVTA